MSTHNPGGPPLPERWMMRLTDVLLILGIPCSLLILGQWPEVARRFAVVNTALLALLLWEITKIRRLAETQPQARRAYWTEHAQAHPKPVADCPDCPPSTGGNPPGTLTTP